MWDHVGPEEVAREDVTFLAGSVGEPESDASHRRRPSIG